MEEAAVAPGCATSTQEELSKVKGTERDGSIVWVLEVVGRIAQCPPFLFSDAKHDGISEPDDACGLVVKRWRQTGCCP